jgi:flagellar hook-basal body protein
MSNYSIGLSGLQSSSQAMDVISNNIANSSTVGYRAGEYIFEDQFYKALNPMDTAREGMGAAKQNIRKLWNMGSIQSSANTLDMAITGAAGLFRLTSNSDDPSQTYYTRNGQFAISKDTDPSYPKRNYIVNENGMYLTGYMSYDGKTLSNTHNNRLTMPPVTIEPVTTTESTVSVTLDARKTAFLPETNQPFDPDAPNTYNNKISQTVYHLGDSGNPHTMELYYRRVEDKNLSVTWDGTYLKFPASAVADPNADTEEKGSVIENNNRFVVLSADSSGPNFNYLSSADRKTQATVTVTDKTYVNVDVSTDAEAYSRVIVNGRDTGVVRRPDADQSTGAISNAITVTTAAGAAEESEVTLSGSYKEGDRVSVKLQGTTFTHTVTAAEVTAAAGVAADLQEAIVTALAAQINAATGVGATATANASVLELLGAANNDQLDVESSVNRAVQLSGLVTVPENAEVMFFNPVTTSTSGSAVTDASTVTITSANPSIQVGQYAWKASDDGAGNITYTKLDAKVTEIANLSITLSKPVTLGATDTILFYDPVTYTVQMQDGSLLSMVGEHKASATSAQTQEFVAVTSQVEIYGSLDGTMFNGADSRFSSDTDITASVQGTVKPLATLQFWGGQNIDAIRFDPVTGQPAYESTVKLKGIVTSSGKTNGVDPIPASENHPLEFDLNLTGTQHYATSFAVDANFQDGYPTSMLNTVTIDDAGKLVGVYSDGREFIAGQVALVNFPATNGLIPVGNNVFQSSYMSGNEISESVVIGKPGERGLGGIRAGAVEGSNVDLANELVKLMIQQRMYSANSQSIRAFDDTLTTTIRMTGG